MSGFLVSPHEQSSDVKEMANYFSGPLYQRPSHSGSLVPGSGWDKVGKGAGERQPPISNKVNLSKQTRTSLSRDQKENPAPLRPRETIRVQNPLESTNGSGSRRWHDRRLHSQKIDLSEIENGKVSTETSYLVSFFQLLPFPS